MREIGRQGGEATLARYGAEHYRQMALASHRPGARIDYTELMDGVPEPKQPAQAEAGRKGGAATRDKHGVEHYQRIGRIGGAAKRKAR